MEVYETSEFETSLARAIIASLLIGMSQSALREQRERLLFWEDKPNFWLSGDIEAVCILNSRIASICHQEATREMTARDIDDAQRLCYN